MASMVDHPEHYKAGDLEVIDIIEAFDLDFHLGNAVKYILRAGRKTEDAGEDLDKAIWYLNRFLDIQVVYELTNKGKAVAELRNAGIDVPLAKRLGYKSKDRYLYTLEDEGYWTSQHGAKFGTNEIIWIYERDPGEFLDLDDDEEQDDEEDTRLTAAEHLFDLAAAELKQFSGPRQKAVKEILDAGFYVPDSEELYYVNPRGSSWKLVEAGVWYGDYFNADTEEIIRYLNEDGIEIAGTIRSTPTVERPLIIRKNEPIEGDLVEDQDGDLWKYRKGEWHTNPLGDTPLSYPQLPSWCAPYSLPREKDDN